MSNGSLCCVLSFGKPAKNYPKLPQIRNCFYIVLIAGSVVSAYGIKSIDRPLSSEVTSQTLRD